MQLNELDEFWGAYGPSVISATRADEANKLDSVRADAVRHFYTSTKPFSTELKQELVDLVGDAFLTSPAHKSARLASK